MSSTRKLWTWVTILSVLSLSIFNSYLWQFYNYGSPQESSTPVKTRSYPITNGFDDEPSLLSINTSSLTRREDYSCGPGRPCANGACCGGGGFCGYGPTYCGDSCVSNCNAHAECGKDSEPPNKKCPLNTCCSEFGFCGMYG
ncbi:carbohydrate-binding module family 18 protein [Daldinia sp. EC12]|nr:carbohydrate-binding module family 18 protein [Daldinia sp. EC12]